MQKANNRLSMINLAAPLTESELKEKEFIARKHTKGAPMLNKFIGKRFGKWTVISLAPKKPNKRAIMLLCGCTCGAEKVIAVNKLRCKKTRQCVLCGKNNIKMKRENK